MGDTLVPTKARRLLLNPVWRMQTSLQRAFGQVREMVLSREDCLQRGPCLGLLSRVSTAAARCRLRGPGTQSRVSSSPALTAHSGHIMIAPCGAFSGLPPIAAATVMGSCATAWRRAH